MKHYNIPIFIPHEGCPQDCIFCNQRKITGMTTSIKPQMIAEQIKEYLSYFPKGEKRVEVAFFGGSFTGLPLSVQESFYQVVTAFAGSVDGIRLSTRPDYINQDVLQLAKTYGVSMIELGAQSAHDAVLKKNNRGHSFADTVRAVAMIRDFGIGVGLQMMTGMMGSDSFKDYQTAQALADLKPDCVRIYPTVVLRDTKLEKIYQKGEYCPQTIEDAVKVCKKILLLFRKREIPVIRLGLHAGEELQHPHGVVAGPFHPAFGELVESRIWRDKIEEKVKGAKDTVCVLVPERELSKAVGHKRENLLYFEKKFGVKVIIKAE